MAVRSKVTYSPGARDRLVQCPSLRLLVEALARLVGSHVSEWASTYEVDLFQSHEDSESWMIEVTRHLPLPVERVFELSLQVGGELSDLLRRGEDVWGSPDWQRVTYLLETARSDGPA